MLIFVLANVTYRTAIRILPIEQEREKFSISIFSTIVHQTEANLIHVPTVPLKVPNWTQKSFGFSV